MTANPDQVLSPAISSMLSRLVPLLISGADATLVGPRGIGLSTIAEVVTTRLKENDVPSAYMDCSRANTWKETYRRAWDIAKDVQVKCARHPVLVVDHCEQLEANEIKHLSAATQRKNPVEFNARLWVGSLDCRYLEREYGVRLVFNPRSFFVMPEYGLDDLLRIYSTVGKRQECEWGEAILHFMHDWCGNDLSLLNGIGAHFYGNWREHLYDSSVMECLDRWLIGDPVVDEYRQVLAQIEGQGKQYLQLLCKGGKPVCHAAAIEHETDQPLRDLYYRGILSSNLIPGFYQFRNLTMKLLAMQCDGQERVSANVLLRKSSNNRINLLLQDVELTLRNYLRAFS